MRLFLVVNTFAAENELAQKISSEVLVRVYWHRGEIDVFKPAEEAEKGR